MQYTNGYLPNGGRPMAGALATVFGTDSGRDLCPPITDELIKFIMGKIKVLSYQPGDKEVTPHDIAYCSGQTDILNQLRALQTWQASQKGKPTNGVSIQLPDNRQS